MPLRPHCLTSPPRRPRSRQKSPRHNQMRPKSRRPAISAGGSRRGIAGFSADREVWRPCCWRLIWRPWPAGASAHRSHQPAAPRVALLGRNQLGNLGGMAATPRNRRIHGPPDRGRPRATGTVPQHRRRRTRSRHRTEDACPAPSLSSSGPRLQRGEPGVTVTCLCGNGRGRRVVSNGPATSCSESNSSIGARRRSKSGPVRGGGRVHTCRLPLERVTLYVPAC